eukprot:309239-Pleurochrysis_carterae.AAC.2
MEGCEGQLARGRGEAGRGCRGAVKGVLWREKAVAEDDVACRACRVSTRRQRSRLEVMRRRPTRDRSGTPLRASAWARQV